VNEDHGGVSVTELAALLREATGESTEWQERITASSTLEDDLELDSIELTALAELVQRRYGDRVDLLAYLRGLDLDELIALTVGDLADHITATCREPLP
jgi:acyl carrier protein